MDKFPIVVEDGDESVVGVILPVSGPSYFTTEPLLAASSSSISSSLLGTGLPLRTPELRGTACCDAKPGSAPLVLEFSLTFSVSTAPSRGRLPLACGLPASRVSTGLRGVVLSSTCWLCCDMERCGVVARLSFGVVLPGVWPVWGVSGRDLKKHMCSMWFKRCARQFAQQQNLTICCALHILQLVTDFKILAHSEITNYLGSAIYVKDLSFLNKANHLYYIKSIKISRNTKS